MTPAYRQLARHVADSGIVITDTRNDAVFIVECLCRDALAAGKGRGKEDDLGSLFPKEVPTVRPFDVKAYLDTNPTEIGIEYRNIGRTRREPFPEFSLCKPYFPV